MLAADLRPRVREGAVRTAWLAVDAGCWIVAILVAIWSRYDYDLTRALAPSALLVLGVGVAVHILVGLLFGPYLIAHVRGSFEEVVGVARTTLMAAAALMIWLLLLRPEGIPRSVPVIGGAVSLVLMLAFRFVLRAARSRAAARRPLDQRVVVFGVGLAGRRLVHNMVRDDQSTFRPVAFVDDDRSKRKLVIDGVPVRGGRHAIGEIARKHEATHLAVAIPGADAEFLREVHQIAADADLQLKVLPTIAEMLSTNPSTRDLRDIRLEDLLGRRPVELDSAAIAEQINGRVVLVTGAGGSIGSELCRQITQFLPGRLVMLDRDESALHEAQLAITGRGLLEGEDLVLADIRDRRHLQEVFEEVRPDVVFHAAALKHLSLLERYPNEAWQTNVLGSLNVLQAAASVGVGVVVNISTDKAADPTSVLGFSKRIAERLTADFAESQAGRYVSVRFGNVLGSRGSVIPAFTEQIRRGGPVTVTHPDVERYFMLIPEACQLVLQSTALGRDGEVMVLEMGTPVRIADVATALIEMSGRAGIHIAYTGLRQGEKLTEILFNGSDDLRQTAHPLVAACDVPALSPSSILGVDGGDRTEMLSTMRKYSRTPLGSGI